jgi:general secretion pathway protein L
MSSLFVLLPAELASASSEFPYLLSSDGRTVAGHASAAASLLPAARGAGTEVVAVVPAGALSWHRVELPKAVPNGGPRLRAVLEGLLEEQLLDEPEALHFALEPQWHAGGAVWVATCPRTWLRTALHVLEAAGRPASRIVPELAPEAEPVLHVTGETGDASVLASGPGGVLSLPLTPSALLLLPPLGEDVPCYAEPPVAAEAESLLQRPVVIQTGPQRWLQAAQSRWDLAQFEFASTGRTRTWRRFATGWGALLRTPQWRPVRWGATLLVAAHVIGMNAWAWTERSALQAKEQAVRASLTSTFPHVRLVVDAPLQMEREVALLRQATGNTSTTDLETLLGALASVAPGRQPSALEYDGRTLRVRGLAFGAPEAERARDALRAQGLVARVDGDALVLSAEGAR